jgi:hypothetical protein
MRLQTSQVVQESFSGHSDQQKYQRVCENECKNKVIFKPQGEGGSQINLQLVNMYQTTAIRQNHTPI